MRLFAAALVAALEMNSYCAGLCSARYQGGEYGGKSQCKCFDLMRINPKQFFALPKKAKTADDVIPPMVYYGVDEMHHPVDDIQQADPLW